jgi:hypothetical protein
MTEEIFPVCGINGYKIPAIPAIIPILKTGGMNPVGSPELFHVILIGLEKGLN